MYSFNKTVLLCSTFLVLVITKCASELPQQTTLFLYSPGEPEFTEVIVKRVHDNLTLMCEIRGDEKPHRYVWNYLPMSEGDVGRGPIQISPMGPSTSSVLTKADLQLSDSGQYICSAPPYSTTKTVLVQTRGPAQCALGAFWCGGRCVLPAYVCDGRPDCRRGEDEAPELCGPQPCNGADKLNCTEGRCISASACCRRDDPLCRQPRCCDLHPQFYRDGLDNEYPALFEDRHAPDDYGFIQSTIYTVTACALIFMIAVVLLVSAICKMHMKRAALRSHARRTYQVQTHRFPPCYEASRLLEGGLPSARISANNSPAHAPTSPVHQLPPSLSESCGDIVTPTIPEQNDGFALARLGAMFTSRYRQVPTQPPDVELQNVHSTSLQSSPTRNRTRLDHYRSPTFTDFDYYPTSETENCGRDLNYMATPVEFFRRRTLNNRIDRIIDQIERPRNLTLQLGRFQLSIPRFGRRSSTDLDRRPDTPNIAEINIDDLDFVRLNGNDTYTLNGRTIRLLGANFENYPNVGTSRPPPYNEAMRYKLYGPPPEYLSRDTLTGDSQAQSNVEMPPRYEEVGSGDQNSECRGQNLVQGQNLAVAGQSLAVGGQSSDAESVSSPVAGQNLGLGQNVTVAGQSLAMGGRNSDVESVGSPVGVQNFAMAGQSLAFGGQNSDVESVCSPVGGQNLAAGDLNSPLGEIAGGQSSVASENGNDESQNGNEGQNLIDQGQILQAATLNAATSNLIENNNSMCDTEAISTESGHNFDQNLNNSDNLQINETAVLNSCHNENNNNMSITDIIDNLPAIDGNENALVVD